VDDVGGKIRPLAQEGFDLVQGRHREGSGWAVLVDERQIAGEKLFDILVLRDPSHVFPPSHLDHVVNKSWRRGGM
jgi:hypothetical protein